MSEYKQEPVAVVDAGEDGKFAEILPGVSVKVGDHLFAAPQPDTMTAIARRKASQIGEQIGVLVRRPDGKVATVENLGRVTWIHADTIPVKRDVLEAWLKEAADDIEDWAAYASEYFQEKHGLAEEIQKWKERAVLLASQEK